MKKTILFVHQSADLYGSDRVLLALTAGLDRDRYDPIVLLPGDGPLAVELGRLGIPVHVVPLLVVGRSSLSFRTLIRIPFLLFRSLSAIRRRLSGVRIDLVHSNTLAVLSGAVWAQRMRIPHVWHVHEIVLRPAIAKHLFPLLLRGFADRVVCNSASTRDALLESLPALERKSLVIPNGIERPKPLDRDEAARFRQRLGIGAGTVLVALVGRINRLKGQGLLVKAAESLFGEGRRNLHFLIVGSPPPGQEHFLETLRSQIAASPAREAITWMDFTEEIRTVWDACDIAAVPSTEPESFGLVALEAMAAGKPVIAADHGGLTELVAHGQTGLRIAPGSAEALAEAIATLADDAGLRASMGELGRQTCEERFSVRSFLHDFSELYRGLTER